MRTDVDAVLPSRPDRLLHRARAVPPGGARRRDDRRRIAEPLRERRAQEPLGHRRATDVPRADDQDPAHDEGRESSAGSSGRSSAIAVTGREPSRRIVAGPCARSTTVEADPFETIPLAQVDGDVLAEQRPELVARLRRRVAGAVGARDGQRTRLGEDRERQRMVRGADADGRRVATEVPPEGVRAPREDEREGAGPAGRDEALGSLVEHGDRPRGRRASGPAPGARAPATAPSPRTPARSPRDRPGASPTRRRCRSGTRSARLAGRRPSHRRADR